MTKQNHVYIKGYEQIVKVDGIKYSYPMDLKVRA